MNMTDIDTPYEDAGAMVSTASSKATARRLRRTRQKLGSYRHDLLVAMRIVNSVEKEMMQSEWENWLADENVRCEQVKLMLEERKGDGKKRTTATTDQTQKVAQQQQQQPLDEKKVENLKRWYESYCGSCHADQEELEAVSWRRSMTG